MDIPDAIPIRHEPDYRTPTIGRCEGGQFYATVVAAFPEGWSGEDWPSAKRWHAVLHRFDEAGVHLGSRIESTGTTADGERQAVAAARLLLERWLDALPGRHYQDIVIAPFEVRFEGALFGLVVEVDDEEEDEEDRVHLELYPDALGFSPPWDGSYDT
ncbi:hypothetical protein [Kitasatospora sp. NPDC018619]|uniref:hypothetical protein n=1 Tax=unclassified Kitasatospora TaxID=2633591 RepID=UPI0037AFFD95